MAGTLSDYEINKRLAEIAGLRWGEPRHGSRRVGNDAVGYMWAEEWSPLTDWSQLGPLLEREGVECVPFENDAAGWDWWANAAGSRGREPQSDLKRAIALAIIAAHEE